MKHIPCFVHTLGYIQPPAPCCTAVVHFPRFNSHRIIYFLIDTGASSTCLHSLDALQTTTLNDLTTCSVVSSGGIGGTCEYYSEPAILLFKDSNDDQLLFPLEMRIQKIDLTKPMALMPNLLGRDVMSVWSLNYDHKNGGVSLYAPDNTPLIPHATRP
jgi:hypothetical protein